MLKQIYSTEAPQLPRFVTLLLIFLLKRFVHLPSSGTPRPKVIEQPDARISESSSISPLQPI